MVTDVGTVGRVPTRRLAMRLNTAIPPALRPLLRAYILGYATAVGPRLLTLLLQVFTTKRVRKGASQESRGRFLESLRAVLGGALGWRRFPAFCAILVGGSTYLEILLERLLGRTASNLSTTTRTRVSRWLSTFFAAGLSLRILQLRKSSAFAETIPVNSDHPPGVETKTVHYAGRTLDLTLFAAVRALDVMVGELWFRRISRKPSGRTWAKADQLVSKLTDPAVFAVSCAAIMWTWLYSPQQLPKAYTKWITSAAAVDSRLIKALQECRSGTLRYGEDTGRAELLQSMCGDYGFPLEWGDPVVAVPFPCEIVHMGCGPSCEYHAFYRFYKSWIWALSTYLPINIFLQLRKPSRKGLERALVSSARSSAFLGAFITLFYYGVCLARTRLGPHIIGKDKTARQKIDGGVCIGAGCLLCGWSVLVETAHRRKELALFVAPRALATLLPRRYSLDKQWRETVVFAASTAVVFTCLQENPERVRGVLGRVLRRIMAQ